MTKKKTVLQSACNFTRVGLEALINESGLMASLELVASSDDIEHCELPIIRLPKVDITILVLGQKDYKLVSFLYLVGEVLPQTYPHSKVVLMGERTHMEMLRRYFSKLMDTYILDHTASLETLYQQLQGIAQSDGNKSRSITNPAGKLTARELLVLRKLLSGETPNQIASDLQLNFRTVSHHKCSALTKLGIRSLYSLVIPALNKQAMTRRPRYLTRCGVQPSQQADLLCLTEA
ncbi:helix-turn-helix transcriptional regulator [Serratia fonticola]|uniref:LuxR C-terminal-related transcriptional regulator n=1 Tax=Serratia fonticola TaxID=47917 RepID=A0ABY9PU45_SERFO|nr:LuxR C-terminal-related transcriptional regulator [Serratia fonticola]WMT16655.1 LuxR C-terminal-related transcriptional regulator [Serratia fonticola]